MKKEKRGISKRDYIKKYNQEKLEEAFKIALDTRKFEIELYWKRTGYFVLFIGAIFVGYYTSNRNLQTIFLSFLGFLLSLLWYMANRGSKFWQENWEAHIEELSTHLDIPIFGIIKIRKHSILNPMGQYPFSLSKVNLMVSLIITISWFLIFIKKVLLLKIEFSFLRGLSICNASIIGILVLLATIVIFLLCRGFAAKIPKRRKASYYFYNYGEET